MADEWEDEAEVIGPAPAPTKRVKRHRFKSFADRIAEVRWRERAWEHGAARPSREGG